MNIRFIRSAAREGRIMPAKAKRAHRKNREPLTDELRAQIVTEKYRRSRSTGKFPSIAELAEKFNRSSSVIQYAVSTAIEDELVSIITIPRPLPKTDRDAVLEEALCAAYPTLNYAIVVQCGKHSIEPANYEEHVGYHLARYFIEAKHLLFKPQSLFAVGGGRAVYMTVHALRTMALNRAIRPMLIASLHGSVGLMMDEKNPNFLPRQGFEIELLDSDDLAIGLAGCFGDTANVSGRTQVMLVANRLTPVDIGKVRKETWWERKDDTHPAICLITLGMALDRPKMTADLAKTVAANLPPPDGFVVSNRALSPFLELYDRAEKVAKAAATDDPLGRVYYPLTDVCYRLELVDHPVLHRSKKGREDRQEMLKYIDAVNELTLHPPPRLIDQSEAIFVAATGRQKAYCIRQFLLKNAQVGKQAPADRRERSVTLAIDSETAEALIAIAAR